MLATLVAAAVVLVPGLGVEVNGARRWFDLGIANFQPSELLKLALPFFLAHVIAARWVAVRRGDVHALLVPAVPVIAIAALLVLFEPDLETAVLISVVGGIVLYVAGLPGQIVATGAGIAAAVATAGVLSTPFRRARFAAWMNPTAYADTFGYQTVQGFIALGSGGWFGRGLGQGRGKWLYIPNAHTDFIFAIIGEELGLFGALFVLGLYVALGVGGVRVARRAPDAFGRLLATGITAWLLLQATINVGSVVGLFPVTGVTLPLVSFGGSSLVFTMLGLGALMSIARAGRAPSRAPHQAPREAAAS
jgi:cell division protein FtsW